MEYIRINNHTNRNYVIVYSNNDFFKTDSIIYKYGHEKITFKIPTIDYRGKLLKPVLCDSVKWRHLTIKNEYLELGKYKIDPDESNEDQVVIYYEDKIN